MTGVPRRRRAWKVVAIGIAVGAGVALALAQPSLSFGASEPAAKTAATVARRHAELLVNLSSTNATRTLAELADQATGPWADQLKADPTAVAVALKKSAAKTRGRVDSIAVSEESAKQTTVLVAASTLVTNASGSKNVTRSYYFVMTLTRTRDGWRVRSMETAS